MGYKLIVVEHRQLTENEREERRRHRHPHEYGMSSAPGQLNAMEYDSQQVLEVELTNEEWQRVKRAVINET